MFDPCGTRRIDGDDILQRLATILNVTSAQLKEALLQCIERAI